MVIRVGLPGSGLSQFQDNVRLFEARNFYVNEAGVLTIYDGPDITVDPIQAIFSPSGWHSVWEVQPVAEAA